MADVVQRARELEAAYEKLNIPHSFWARQARALDPEKFRGHDQFLWQGAEYPFEAILEHIGAVDLLQQLLVRLEEDFAFGAERYATRSPLSTFSRDQLDSVLEIGFLLQTFGALCDIRVLDIGAGYGRFAHRLATIFRTTHVYCADAVPMATAICEEYLHFRGVTNAGVVPLHEIDSLPPIDLAVNIHSWPECTREGIRFWLNRLTSHDVPYLFVVPHDEAFTATHDNGASFLPYIGACGYKIVRRWSKHFGPPGWFGDYHYFLFQR